MKIGGFILVAKGVTADDDRFGPAWYEAWHVFANDRFAEYGAVEDIADGAVGGLPHFF